MQPEIIQKIKANSNLIFVDAELKTEAGIQELLLEHELIIGSKRSLVFLYVDNSITSVGVLLSFLNSHHTIALLSPRLNVNFKQNLESLYNPLFIYDVTRQEVRNFSKHNVSSEVILFKNEITPGYEIHKSLKLLLSTSGTTGSPKFVKLSESNIVSNALSIIDYLPITHEDVTPLNLPVYYSYGLSILTTNSMRGGKVICTNKDILNKAFWQDLEKYRYSSLAGVPYVYEVLFRIGFTKKNYPSLKYLTQAGGRLNTELIKVFRDYARANSLLFYVMYGQTEATARMSFLDPKYLDTKLGSIGKPIKNGSFIIDDHMGELCYSGPNVFGGYAERIGDLKEFEVNAALRTGDIAMVDKDGFYFITGRMKRFVKIIGSRINLDEVEAMLKNEFPGIPLYCMGLHDKYILVVTDVKSFDLTLVFSFISKELSLHKSFIKTSCVDKIPLTENGKINYSIIQKQYDTE